MSTTRASYGLALTPKQEQRLRELLGALVDEFVDEAAPARAREMPQGDRFYHRKACGELARLIEATKAILERSSVEDPRVAADMLRAERAADAILAQAEQRAAEKRLAAVGA